MSPKRASDLVKAVIVDLDAALASNGKEALDERHSALASAMMLGIRLLGGVAINTARIATALEKRNEIATLALTEVTSDREEADGVDAS